MKTDMHRQLKQFLEELAPRVAEKMTGKHFTQSEPSVA